MKNNQIALIFNSGSTSIKSQLYEIKNNKSKLICSLLAERIFIEDSKITLKFKNEKKIYKIDLPNHNEAFLEIIKVLITNKIINSPDDINYTGHRVVHGGNYYNESVKIDDDVIKNISELCKLAPLHNPSALSVIKLAIKNMQNALHMCSFDTAFHQTIPIQNFLYPIPCKYYKDDSIKKYGAHGISYNYILIKLQEILNKKDINAVVCHLGGGSSICAIKNSKSFNTSMGLTPLGGLIMGTRCGDLDPSVIEYLLRNKNSEEVFNILNKESGLLGISGISSDLREICNKIDSGDEHAILTLDIFTNNIVDFIIKYHNYLGKKIDALVFSGGIGENSKLVVSQVINKLNLLDYKISLKKLNEKYEEYNLISEDSSINKIFQIRTNEEKMILKDLLSIFKLSI